MYIDDGLFGVIFDHGGRLEKYWGGQVLLFSVGLLECIGMGVGSLIR